MFVAVVRAPRPEEAFQSVSFASRHDMDVEVGDALADAVIDRDECPFRSEGPFDGGLQLLNGLKQRADLSGRQVRQCGNVPGRYQQNMAGEERPAIEESDRILPEIGRAHV